MSFYVKLNVDGHEYNTLYCSYRFVQLTDAIGKPSSIPKGGSIILSIESTGNTDLFDWMTSPTMTKNGFVTFYRRDTLSKLKVLSFTDAYCVDYQETYSHVGEHPLQIDIELSAKELSLNDSVFKNNWPE